MHDVPEEELLNTVRPFCDPATGEVLQRVPEELMRQLRTAKLARGVPRSRNRNTQTFATWYVFLTAEIRERVLSEMKAINQKRTRSRKSAAPDAAGGNPPAEGTGAAEDATGQDSPPARSEPPAKVPVQRGLGEFRRARRPAK